MFGLLVNMKTFSELPKIGIVVWEILERLTPYYEEYSLAKVAEMITKEHKILSEPKHIHCPPELWILMKGVNILL